MGEEEKRNTDYKNSFQYQVLSELEKTGAECASRSYLVASAKLQLAR
jgi:hypothetical protein